MSSYVWMRVLESTPERYDRGLRWLSRGAIDAVYRVVAERVAAPGRRVLDVGCGTGGLSLACAALGAEVVGIDRDAGMLEVARGKLGGKAGDGERDPGDGRRTDAGAPVTWVELGALGIEDRFPPASFDAVVACLLFSELLPEERAYVLDVARSRLRPGGTVAIADEVAPPERGARLWWRLRRLPLAAATWLLTQATTRPVDGLADAVRCAGFTRVTEVRLPGDFLLVQGRAAGGAS